MLPSTNGQDQSTHADRTTLNSQATPAVHDRSGPGTVTQQTSIARPSPAKAYEQKPREVLEVLGTDEYRQRTSFEAPPSPLPPPQAWWS